ncbi:hypothetical protein HJC23_006348 [Cyclotella cryptica]|uniref:Uncharacterized protein n=1 Tax=Cyclotella cryptica TaxID=29204 RepID=A0ABD3Q3W4_9STRA
MTTRSISLEMKPDWFIEIHQPKEDPRLPARIDCYILVNVDPKCCGPLARELNAILPLRSTIHCIDAKCDSSELVANAKNDQQQFPITDHLKRIRRRPTNANETVPEIKADTTEVQCAQNNTTNAVTMLSEKKEGNDNTFTVNSGSIGSSPLENARKRSKTDDKCSNNNSKQKVAPWSLDLLVGSVDAVDNVLHHASELRSNKKAHPHDRILTLESILAKHDLSTNCLVRRSLPGRPAESKEELQQWNSTLWPTLFFEKKTVQFKEEELLLTPEETAIMMKGMQAAVEDAHIGRQQWKEYASNCCQGKRKTFEYKNIHGVIVMNPKSASVVSRASDERYLQCQPMSSDDIDTSRRSSFPDETNPLCTSTILAIQGVSRAERRNAMGHGMESDEFKRGQYLCTGYDVYLTKEPSAYEAMALVHSRVRRVVFGIADKEMGGLGGVADSIDDGFKGGIHCLPGTNHRYRAFRLNECHSNATDDDDTESRKRLIESLRILHSD